MSPDTGNPGDINPADTNPTGTNPFGNNPLDINPAGTPAYKLSVQKYQQREFTSDLTELSGELTNGITTLTLLEIDITDPPTEKEVQDVANKVDECVSAINALLLKVDEMIAGSDTAAAKLNEVIRSLTVK